MKSDAGYVETGDASESADEPFKQSAQRKPQAQRPQYRCKVCSYTWMVRRSRKSSDDAETYAKPRICPGCHSILWDREDVVKRTCKRCGYTWFSSMNPNRCPQCRTHRWNESRNPCKCNFCGYTWERKVDKIPKTCPNCKRFVWNEPTEEHECTKCGTKFAVRVNVLGRCPECGAVCYHCVCRECGHKWVDVSGKHPRACPECGLPFKDPKRSEMRKGASRKRIDAREGDEKAIELLKEGKDPMSVALETGLSFERVKSLKSRLDDGLL